MLIPRLILSRNTIPPFDIDLEKTIYYLRKLIQALLDIEGAQELISMLQKMLKTSQKKTI